MADWIRGHQGKLVLALALLVMLVWVGSDAYAGRNAYPPNGNETSLYDTGYIAASADVLSNSITLSPACPRAALRFTVSLVSTNSVVYCTVSNGTSTVSDTLFNGETLVAGRIYTDVIGAAYQDAAGQTLEYNVRLGTGSGFGRVVVDEIRDGGN